MKNTGKLEYLINDVCPREKSRQNVRKIIPILIYWAKKKEANHEYGDLTFELFGHRSYSGIGKQLDYVASVFDRLREECQKDNIPTLNALVRPQKSSLPSKGFNRICPEYNDLSFNEKRDIVYTKNQEAFEYPHWDWVLDILGLTPFKK